jgi:hypothetical protein
MSKIKSMIVKDTTTWIEFPDITGFEVNVRYVTREDLLKIRSASLTFKFNKRTRQREEEVNNDKFLELYAEQAIIGWRGLKVKHLPLLMPVDISSLNPEEEIQYTAEEALELLRNSGIFDSFITDAMSDFEQFSRTKSETTVKN